mmetsp:Transcript_652/g.1108  ORF Transcript_652/g.1108 Transcript_652/m.1108 type:complete len:219 (-) Transcript_652:101-757(-)
MHDEVHIVGFLEVSNHQAHKVDKIDHHACKSNKIRFWKSMFIGRQMCVTRVEELNLKLHWGNVRVILFQGTIGHNNDPPVRTNMVFNGPCKRPFYYIILQHLELRVVGLPQARVENVPVTARQFSNRNTRRCQFNFIYTSWGFVVCIPVFVHKQIESWRRHPRVRVLIPEDTSKFTLPASTEAKLCNFILWTVFEIPGVKLELATNSFRGREINGAAC